MGSEDMNEFDKIVPKRNGPAMPTAAPLAAAPLPSVPGFDHSDDAEEEIRRSIRRHHEQKAQIAQLQTDLEHWRHRAELAEASCKQLEQKLTDSEAQVGELKDTITELRTQFENGVEIWLRATETLRHTPHVKIVNTQKTLEQRANERAIESIPDAGTAGLPRRDLQGRLDQKS